MLLPCALASVLFVAACELEQGAELLQVDAVAPSEAAFGDSVQISGDGFALGNSVTVTLSGEAFQAGREPEPIELSLPARAESSRDLSLELPRAHEAEFCGRGEEAGHATFRGDVRVAIASRLAGAPPVVGTLHGAVLELYPSVKSPAAEAAAVERARRVRDFFGMELALGPQGGLTVVALTPGGRAQRAELRAGDRIVRAGGTTVLSPTDLVPEPSRVLDIFAVREGVERRFTLAADGFSPRPPARLAALSVPILGLALALLAWASPLGKLGAVLFGNWRGSVAAQPRRQARPALAALLGDMMGALACVAVGATFTAPVIRRAPVDLSFGMLALMTGSAILLALSDLFGARAKHGSWTLRAGLRASLDRAFVVAPAAVVVFGMALTVGLGAEELGRAQQRGPWTWNAFTNPGWTLFVGLLLASTLAGGARATRASLSSASASQPRRGAMADGLFGWLYTCSVCAWAVLAFFGGDGGSASAEAHWPPWTQPGLALVKYALLLLGVLLLRRASLHLSLASLARVSWRVCVPIAFAALILGHVFPALAELSDFGRWLAARFGAVSFAAALSFAVLLAAARLGERRAPRSSAPLSPWL